MLLESNGARPWEVAAREKRDAVNTLIPGKWRLPFPVPPALELRDVTGSYIRQFLSEREVQITETSATEIVQQTSTGKWKAFDVAEAFCHRAALAHQITPCLHEIFFSTALPEAKKLDEYFAKHKKPKGPLHGLPISLKDQFHVPGVETTMGYVGWIGTFEGKKGTGKEKAFESELVRNLRNLGVVLYCKTSVPHTLMSGETINNIIGYTFNPKNRLLSAGGSSGGEGALVALKGSPLGIGTDIGGSVRIPAAFNGLYGLKPSSGRLPYHGVANSMDGQNSLLSVLGPLASSVSDLELFFKCVLITEPWNYDPLVVEIPWRDEIRQDIYSQSKKLVFGVMKCDGQAMPQPPVTRAMNAVVDAIESLGHRVIDWEPPLHKRGVDLVYKIWKFDGGRDVHAAFGLSKEPPAAQITDNYGLTPFEEQTATEIARINVEKRTYQKEYMDYWNGTSAVTGTGQPVDAIIMPLATFAAARPGRYSYHGYSMIANVLDYSTSVFPVTAVDKNIDKFDTEYVPFSELDEKIWKDYDPETYHGSPVGIQLMCRRFQEEKVLALTELIANAVRDCNKL